MEAAGGVSRAMESAGGMSRALDSVNGLRNAVRAWDGTVARMPTYADLLGAAQQWTSQFRYAREQAELWSRTDAGQRMAELTPLLNLDFSSVEAIPMAINFPATEMRALTKLAAEDILDGGADADTLGDLDRELDDADALSDFLERLGTNRQRSLLILSLDALAQVINYVDSVAGVTQPAHLMLLIQALFAMALAVSYYIGDA